MNAQPPLQVRLRDLRMAANLTLESLAEKSGISVRAISDIERGVSARPRRSTLLALARGLEIGADTREWLLRPTLAEKEARTGLVPSLINDFVGREDELQYVMEAMSVPGGLAIVTGPPGIGKTTLVLRAARQAAGTGPVLFTDLMGDGASPATPLEVIRRLLEQADIGTSLPSTLDRAASMWRDLCATIQPIVILDNAGREEQVRPVFVDGVHFVIVTSRRSMAGLTATSRLNLQPLPIADGIRLLEQVIPPAQQSRTALREIAQACSGNTLALRIAGNHVASRPLITAGGFASRLGLEQRRVRLLTAGDLSIEAAFTLSYDGLTPPAARLFQAISMIEGRTFDANLAAAGTGDDLEQVEDLLEDLVESGFLEADEGNRYRMHDLTRAFGRSRIADEGQDREVTLLLRQWLLHELGRNAAEFTTVSASHEAPRDALRPSSNEEAASWIRTEVEHWWPALVSAGRDGEHAVVVELAVLLQEGFAHLWVGWGNWVALYEVAVASARALQDDGLIARLLGTLHWASRVEKGDEYDGVAMTTEIVERAMAAGDGLQIAWGNYHLAWALLRRQQPLLALEAVVKAHEAFVVAGGAGFESETLALKAAILVEAGQASRASEVIVNLRNRLDDYPLSGRQRNGRMVSLEELARVASRDGEHDLAVSAADAQLALVRPTRSDYLTARARINRARVLIGGRRLDEAEADLSLARSLLAQAQSRALTSALERLLGDLSQMVNDAREVS